MFCDTRAVFCGVVFHLLFAADPYSLSRYGPGGFLSRLSEGPLASCEGLSRAAELRRALTECAGAEGGLQQGSAAAQHQSPSRQRGATGAAASASPSSSRAAQAGGAAGSSQAQRVLASQLEAAVAAVGSKKKARRRGAAEAEPAAVSYGMWSTLELAPPLYQAVLRVRFRSSVPLCRLLVWRLVV